MRLGAALLIALALPLAGARAQSVFDPRYHTVFPADRAMSLIHPCNALPESFTQMLSGTWTPGDAEIERLEKDLPGALWMAIHNARNIAPDTQQSLMASITNHAFQYGGLLAGGRRLIFVNATLAHDIDFDGSDRALPATMPNWRARDAFHPCNAGPSDFTVTYDVESGKFGDFWFAGGS